MGHSAISDREKTYYIGYYRYDQAYDQNILFAPAANPPSKKAKQINTSPDRPRPFGVPPRTCASMFLHRRRSRRWRRASAAAPQSPQIFGTRLQASRGSLTTAIYTQMRSPERPQFRRCSHD